MQDFEIPAFGNEALDSLRNLQLILDNIDDPRLKKECAREAVAEVPSEGLIDEHFEVESAMVVGSLYLDGYRPRRYLFNHGMRFIGKAAAYNYFRNPYELVDCLTVRFIEPEVILPEHNQGDFDLFTFEVPVLAIDALHERLV